MTPTTCAQTFKTGSSPAAAFDPCVADRRHRRRQRLHRRPARRAAAASPLGEAHAGQLGDAGREAGAARTCRACAPTSTFCAPGRGGRRGRRLRLHAARRGGAGGQAPPRRRRPGDRPQRRLPPGGGGVRRVVRGAPVSRAAPGVYGLTELHRDEVASAALVANPGCYPTAALLALAPLRQLGLVDVVIDAKSGVSGAGKTPKAATALLRRRLGPRRLRPAVAPALSRRSPPASRRGCRSAGGARRASVPRREPAAAAHAPSLTFVPHLVPLQRGISETDLRARRHAAAAGPGAGHGAVPRLLRRRAVRRGLRRAAAAQGRGRHQLLPHLRARRRARRPHRRDQRDRQPDEGRVAGRPCRT